MFQFFLFQKYLIIPWTLYTASVHCRYILIFIVKITCKDLYEYFNKEHYGNCGLAVKTLIASSNLGDPLNSFHIFEHIW